MALISCDDVDDASRSLSIIYGVEKSDVARVCSGDWPQWLTNAAENEEPYQSLFNSTYIPELFRQHLNAGGISLPVECAFYHRTSYDGTREWFSEGLLPSSDAALVFLQKVKVHLEDYEVISSSIHENLSMRESFEGAGAGGPYAFDVLDDAKGAGCSGSDYRLPEFFIMDGGVIGGEELRDVLLRKLKPVVVKFRGKTQRPDCYITNLWHYLFREYGRDGMSGTSHFTCTFSGGGIAVPVENIVDLIELESN